MTGADIQAVQAASAMACVYGQSKEAGVHALAEALNELAAAGAENPEVQVRIMIPEDYRKSRLFAMQKQIEKTCSERGIPLISLHHYKTPAVSLPLVTAMCTGMAARTGEFCNRAKPGRQIVLAGWAGLAGMLRIAKEREDELKERFAPAFIKQIESLGGGIFAEKEIQAARDMGACGFRQITEGGIFAALWNLAREAGTGIEVDLKKISVLQETIEVCEYYRLNPYQLVSTGSFLVTACDGEELAGALRRYGKEAVVIGRMTDNNDKVMHNGEEIRYIDRPAPDELNKIIGHTKRGY